jgi:hypothetical protein
VTRFKADTTKAWRLWDDKKKEGRVQELGREMVEGWEWWGWAMKTALSSVNRRLHDHLSGKYWETLNATERNGVQISSDFNVTV